MGGNQVEKIRQLIHAGRFHVHAVFLLVIEQVPTIRQSKRVHHVRHVREELLHVSQTSVRSAVEERAARGSRRQGKGHFFFFLNCIDIVGRYVLYLHIELTNVLIIYIYIVIVILCLLFFFVLGDRFHIFRRKNYHNRRNHSDVLL